MARKPAPRRGATPSRKTTPQQPANNQWFFLLVGLVIGLSVGGVAYLSKTQSEPSNAVAQPEPTTKASTEKAEDEASPNFDFYAVLPEMEVVVPKEEMPAPSRPSTAPSQPEKPIVAAEKPREAEPTAPTESSPPATTEGVRYMLQAGSFRSDADADRRRAELVLHGFTASIQPVELDNGDTWHRVMIGPYSNAQSMSDAKDKLASAGIDTLATRARQ